MTCLSPSCDAHVSFCRSDLTVAPLAPPVSVSGFHRYYEAIRLLTSHWVLSEIPSFNPPTTNEWNWSDLPGMYALPCVLAMPIDPGGNYVSLHDRYVLLPATVRRVSASTCSTYEAGIGFTLSHYGSHTSLPTLKPDLTVWAPRLCTDCLPGFVRAGVSPTYTAYTELAHPQRCPALHMSKRRIMIQSLRAFVNRLRRLALSHLWRYKFPSAAVWLPPGGRSTS